MEHNFGFAILLTLFAGISTVIGGFISFFIKRDNVRLLALGLGFSAGIMIYVSLVEIIKQSTESINAFMGNSSGEWIALGAFIAGLITAAAVDYFLPDKVNQDCLEIECQDKMHRLGIFIAVAIAIHNFPEGLATFMAGMSNPALGVSIAVAIAIHNIPEGIAVALPIYNATNSRSKALWLTFLSGMAEPLGALIGYFLLKSILNGLTFGILFAMVAGIMIYIAFDELLPTAKEYGNGHIEIVGVTCGMIIMWISLILL